MTIEEVIKGLRIERECVSRDCDRDCANCDIVQEKNWLLSVYDNAINILEKRNEAKQQQYLLPVKIQIKSKDPNKDPNKVVKEIADSIYDIINDYVNVEDFDTKVSFFDAEYSIHKKMCDEDFID